MFLHLAYPCHYNFKMFSHNANSSVDDLAFPVSIISISRENLYLRPLEIVTPWDWFRYSSFLIIQSWQHWHLIKTHWTTFKEWKGIHFYSNLHVNKQKNSFPPPQILMYIFIRILGKKLIILHSFNIAWCIWIGCECCQLCVLWETRFSEFKHYFKLQTIRMFL